jgi:hypothetical protein
MDFLAETILLPREFDGLFYKTIDNHTDIIGKKVKVYSESETFEGTVEDCRAYPDFILYQVDGHSVDTHMNILTEVDLVDEPLQINFENILKYENDAVEHRLKQEMRRDPSLAKKIPKELWHHPIFKRIIDVERTKGKIRSLDSIGKSTNTIDLEFLDGPATIVNEFLGVKTTPDVLQKARQRKTRAKPTCKGSNCTGGRTRRFKK